jgi:hypothetical protein
VSQLSLFSTVPFPHVPGVGYSAHALVSNVHPGPHASVPGANPRLVHDAPSRSVGSHCSPAPMVPSPQYAAPFTAGVQRYDVLNFVSVRLPNASVIGWSGIGTSGMGHLAM